MVKSFIKVLTQQTQPSYPLNRPVIIQSPINIEASLDVDIDGNTLVVFATPDNTSLITIAGDVTGSGTTPITVALITTGVAAGTYNSVTVDTKGRVTAGQELSYLTGNQNISVTGDVLGSGATAINVTLVDVATPGTYNSVTIDSKGRVITGTNQAYLTGNQNITISGDASGSGTTAITLTLATVATPGTFNTVTINAKGLVTGGSNAPYLTANQAITLSGDVTGSGATAITATLANTGINAGNYKSVTVDSKGRVTAGANAARMQMQWTSGAVVSNDTTYFVFDAPYAGTINSMTYFAGTGSYTVAIKIAGVNVTGLAAIVVNSATPNTTAATATNTFTAGQTIAAVITGATSSPTDTLLSLNITWN